MREHSAILPLLISPIFLLAACSGDEPEVPSCTKPGACTLDLVSGGGQSGSVVTMLPQPVKVRAVHPAASPAPPAEIRWAVIEGGGSVTPEVTNTDAMGEASVIVTLGETAGVEAMKIEATVVGSDTKLVIVQTVVAGAPKTLEVVSGNGQSAIAGAELPEPLVVSVVDQYGNPIEGRRVGWTATAGGGSVEIVDAATNAEGVVSARATVGPTSGSENNVFTASSPGLPGSVRFIATGESGPAAILVLESGDRQGGTRGAALGESLVVKVTDATDNAVLNVQVDFAAVTAGGTVEPATVMTDDMGFARTVATLGIAPGQYEFTASSAALAGSPVRFLATAFPPICSADDWCWQTPSPQGNTINGMHSVTPTDVWLVGDHGTVLRWIGTAWEGAVTPTTLDLNDVYGAQGDDVWAVGEDGVILHYNGADWSGQGTVVTARLSGVWGAARDDVWAVGDSGTILHYDGMGWTTAPSGTTERLSAVWGAAADDVWAVGDRGTVLRYDGTTWNTTISGSNEDLLAVFGVMANDVWIVGERDSYLRWNGSTFLTYASNTTASLHDVFGTQVNEVWAVGDRGRIRRWNGTQWSSVISRTGDSIYAIAPTDQGLLAAGSGGLVLRKTGMEDWQQEATRRLRAMQGVWGTGADDIWAVGLSGTILHYDGTTWTAEVDIPRAEIFSIAGTGPSDIWAVGSNGYIGHYDGTVWVTVPNPTAVALLAVWPIAPDDAWAVGEEGTMLHWDGTTWGSVAAVASATLYGVWGASSNDVWAVGDVGTVLHWDGATWTADDTITANWLLGVRGLAADDIWAFGVTGTVLHYDGTTWTSAVNPAMTDAVYSVFPVSATDAVAVGDRGLIMRYNGVGWSRQVSGTDNLLYGVYGADSTDLWVVGDTSTVLRWNP